jgi:hypothetical protein
LPRHSGSGIENAALSHVLELYGPTVLVGPYSTYSMGKGGDNHRCSCASSNRPNRFTDVGND